MADFYQNYIESMQENLDRNSRKGPTKHDAHSLKTAWNVLFVKEYIVIYISVKPA